MGTNNPTAYLVPLSEESERKLKEIAAHYETDAGTMLVVLIDHMYDSMRDFG